MGTIYNSQTLKARKRHRCLICGTPIHFRDFYHRTKGLYEGEWQNWAAHSVCHDLWDYQDSDGEVYQVDLQEITRTAEKAGRLHELVDQLHLGTALAIAALAPEELDERRRILALAEEQRAAREAQPA